MLAQVRPKLLTAEVIMEFRRQYPRHRLSLCVHSDYYEQFKELDTFIRVVGSPYLRKEDEEGDPIAYIMASPEPEYFTHAFDYSQPPQQTGQPTAGSPESYFSCFGDHWLP